MKTKHSDDLFAETTMTFGEHLDALRIALFKAVLGLMVGCVFGLIVGDYFVAAITDPLQKAMAVYYKTEADKQYEKWSADRLSRGLTLPYTTEEIHDLVTKHNLLFQIMSVDPQQAVAEALRNSPQFGSAVNASAVPPESGAAAGATQASAAAPESVAPESVAAGGGAETPASSATAIEKRLAPIFVFHSVDDDDRIRPIATGITEPFSIWLKASLVVGIVLSSPWVFYQIWSFVAEGLYPHEKRYVHLFLPFSLGLFLTGASLAYLFVFQPVLGFLLNFNSSLGIDPEPRINEWLGFVLILPLGFGISFQLPLVMLFLNRLGIFSIEAYIQKWRIAVLVIFVLSAVLTPADPYSILFMAVPLTLLYFGGVLLCRYLPAHHSPLESTS